MDQAAFTTPMDKFDTSLKDFIGTKGEVAGYLSLQVRPSAEEVAVAEAAYARIRAGGRGLTVAAGRIRTSGLRGAAGRLFAQMRFQIAIAFLILIAMVAATGWSGYDGMRQANAAVQDLYANRLACAIQLGTVSRLSRENWGLITGVTLGRNREASVKRIHKNRARITKELEAYNAKVLTGEEEQLAQQLNNTRAAYKVSVIDPAMAAIAEGRSKDLREILLPINEAQLDALAELCTKLIQLQDNVGKQLVEQQARTYRSQMLTTMAVGSTTVLFAVIGAAVYWFRFAPIAVERYSVSSGEVVAEVLGRHARSPHPGIGEYYDPWAIGKGR